MLTAKGQDISDKAMSHRPRASVTQHPASKLRALEAKHARERAQERRDFWLFWIAVSLSYAGAYWLAVKLTEWVTA